MSSVGLMDMTTPHISSPTMNCSSKMASSCMTGCVNVYTLYVQYCHKRSCISLKVRVRVLRRLGLRQFVTMYMYVHVHVHVYVTQSHVLVCLGHPYTVCGSTGHEVELWSYMYMCTVLFTVHCILYMYMYINAYTIGVHTLKLTCRMTQTRMEANG